MKIDTTKIEGYENMTAEEKLKALEEFDIDTTGYVDKKLFDKTSSELASIKKKYQETLGEEERAKQEREEMFQNMQNELESLKKEKQLADSTAQFLSLGYDEELAKSTAKAFVDGDMASVFKYQKQHQENIEKKIKTELTKGTPEPNSDNEHKQMTKDELRKMSPSERLKFAEENPDAYKQIYTENQEEIINGSKDL